MAPTSRPAFFRFLSSAIFCTAVMVGGCARGPSVPMYPVTGAVTFDGSPVERGSVVFDPADGKSPPVMAGIEGGRYEARVPQGEKIVRVDAVRTTDKSDEYGGRITESFISRTYNDASTMRMTVSADGPNTFDIVMESAGKRLPGKR
jgi:hypothetical protein